MISKVLFTPRYLNQTEVSELLNKSLSWSQDSSSSVLLHGNYFCVLLWKNNFIFKWNDSRFGKVYFCPSSSGKKMIQLILFSPVQRQLLMCINWISHNLWYFYDKQMLKKIEWIFWIYTSCHQCNRSLDQRKL